MNIVYASNDLYAKHLAVSMYSLFDHNQESEEIHVHLLSVNISSKSQKYLTDIAEQFGRTVHIYPLDNINERFDFEFDTRGFDVSALSRLFIASILSKTVSKVIYLDCDTVVTDSLLPIWQEDLGDCLVGAVIEPTVPLQIKQQIDLAKHDKYFNSGVLVIDLKKWRQENTEETLLRYYQSKGGNLFACDQDTINGALKGCIKPLAPRYNFFTNYKYFRYGQLVRMVPEYKIFSKQEFADAKRYPALLHFLGDERPWKNGNYNPYREYYEKYLSLTPWKDSPKETGMEFYLFCYHILNVLTPVVPFLRSVVSRMLGMRVIDSRKKMKK